MATILCSTRWTADICSRYIDSSIYFPRQVIAESGSPSGTEQRPFYDFLEGCLRHKAEMVIFEAARAICDMKDVSSRYGLSVGRCFDHCTAWMLSKTRPKCNCCCNQASTALVKRNCIRHEPRLLFLLAICRELMPAVTVLQLFLSSSKPVLRFAAVRTLNKVAQTHPMSVTNCNIDMESLIADQNRSIATLAITTLLKTGLHHTE